MKTSLLFQTILIDCPIFLQFIRCGAVKTTTILMTDIKHNHTTKRRAKGGTLRENGGRNVQCFRVFPAGQRLTLSLPNMLIAAIMMIMFARPACAARICWPQRKEVESIDNASDTKHGQKGLAEGGKGGLRGAPKGDKCSHNANDNDELQRHLTTCKCHCSCHLTT